MLEAMADTCSATSSIGAAWPPVQAAHERVRGMYNLGVLQTPGEVRDFVAEVEAVHLPATHEAGASRLSVRAVMGVGQLALLEQSAAGVTVEGALPFRRDGSELAVVYLGWNHQDRAITPDELAGHRALLARAAARPRKAAGQDVRDLRDKGFEFAVVDADTSDADRLALAGQFLALYAAFGYDAQDVRDLLENRSNTVAYIRHGGAIVSTAMAEAASIAIAGMEPLEMVEITEAFTLPDYRGHGLYRNVSRYLLDIIRRSDRRIDVLYGESNLASPGVIFAAHENGRSFSSSDRSRFGLLTPSFGVLPQNFAVNDGTHSRKYNDFALSYYPL
jgi:hypothetical protein